MPTRTFTDPRIPESLRDRMELFLRLERQVLEELDPRRCAAFDELLADAIGADDPDQASADASAGASAGFESFVADSADLASSAGASEGFASSAASSAAGVAGSSAVDESVSAASGSGVLVGSGTRAEESGQRAIGRAPRFAIQSVTSGPSSVAGVPHLVWTTAW